MSAFTNPSRLLSSTLTPFLYPCLDSAWLAKSPRLLRRTTRSQYPRRCYTGRRWQSTEAHTAAEPTPVERPPVDVNKYDHLNPQPLEYSDTPFTDACTLTISAGGGGHGCISFLREKYIPNGPANGGDGGTGGSVYIQAVRGETSLHKLARRGTLKAGRGKNGQGSLRGGKRGEDVLLTVPVGTVVREISRIDPLEEEDRERRRSRGYGRDSKEPDDPDAVDQSGKWRRDKWLLYPGTLPKSFTSADFPALPRPRRNNLSVNQPPAPLRLDLDKPMEAPMLLAAGAIGGLGNPHFVTKSVPRPKYATKGDDGLRIQVQLELKLLADVGLVGLPNAGKSTLLRALTNARARVGDWAFTTLSPNVGTVVLDNQKGRLPTERPPMYANGEVRSHFTIADNPGLIEDAHLDRGLGLGFLRHIERAGVLAFVIDLSAGDAVEALKALWREVSEYENLRAQELNAETERSVPDEQGMVSYQPYESSISPGFEPEPSDSSDDVILNRQATRSLPPLALQPLSAKPWLVVATKADKPETQENFAALREYLVRVQAGDEEHPSGKKNAWRKHVQAVPVCAMKKEGVENLRAVMLGLL